MPDNKTLKEGGGENASPRNPEVLSVKLSIPVGVGIRLIQSLQQH